VGKGKGKLKTAVLGLGDGGQVLLKAAAQIDYFQIEAVADRDSNLAAKVAEQYRCAAFDDYRQLIITMASRLPADDRRQADDANHGHSGVNEDTDNIRCLLVAAGLHSCEKQVLMAMKKRFHILKLAPAARNFEEAAALVRLAKGENIKFAVANPQRFAPGFVALRDYLGQGRIEQVFLIMAFCSCGGQVYPAWQMDPKLAGGGVLLQNCYGIIDQMVLNFGVPQQVYSLTTSQAQDKQQRHYVTEDTAVVTMKFSHSLIGSIIAFRRTGIGPGEEFLRIYGKDKILTVSNNRFNISDGLGEKTEESEYDDDPLGWYMELLKSFAASVLHPGENKLCSSGEDNLKNMAVIESAYLSTRTGFPEEPTRILQMTPLQAPTV